MSGSTESAAPLTVAAVAAEFGPAGWQLQEGCFCWSAVRRPTPTAVEVMIGHTLRQLAEKLRAEP